MMLLLVFHRCYTPQTQAWSRPGSGQAAYRYGDLDTRDTRHKEMVTVLDICQTTYTAVLVTGKCDLFCKNHDRSSITFTEVEAETA